MPRLSSHGSPSPYEQMRAVLTPPLSTRANPGNSRRTKPTKSKPMKTPHRQTSHQTPRPQWSLPRSHYTTCASPSDSESSEIDGNDEVNEILSSPLGLSYIDNKENMSSQHNANNNVQQKVTKPNIDQSHKQQPIESVVNTSRDRQLAQKCFDSAMEIMDSSTFSTISDDSGSTSSNNNGKEATFDDDTALNRSIDCLNRVREVRELISPTAPEFINTVSTSPSRDVNEDINQPPATQDQNQPYGAGNNHFLNESTTLSNYNCEDADMLSPLPQVRSPVPSLANSIALSDASSAVTDLFAVLRTDYCEEEHGEDIRAEDIATTKEREECCKNKVTTERKRWIEETLLRKKEYQPIQTKERDECCKNKDCHDLTTERKRWIEETLLIQAQDTLKRLSPKHSFLAYALADASNELIVQRNKRQLDATLVNEARDESTVMSPQKSPQVCHQLDHSFLASALVATNMLLTPPRREKYSSKPSRRTRMSIGASPHPFSPASAASSVFTETASNIILHALKQLTPKLSANKQDKQKQKSITPSRKCDLLSIASEMKSLDARGSDGKEELKAQSEQTRLVERVEKLERLVTSQSARSSGNDQEESNELRRELQKSNLQLESERQRVSMLISNLNNTQEVHSNVERQLREKVQRLEEELVRLRDSQRQSATEQADTNEASLDTRVASSLADKNTAELEELRRANKELLERQRMEDIKHHEDRKENENLRSQLLVLSNESTAKEQSFSAVLEFVRSMTESFSSTNQKQEQELNAKKDEMTCLRRSLELMSCELVMSTNEVKDLRSENARLQDELKRMKAGKKWPF